MSNYWNYVFNYINQVDHVYLAVGCAMPQYRFSDEVNSPYMFDITEKNNQQYPCFLNKLAGKKMVILIDNELEFTQKSDSGDQTIERDLVIQQYFKRIGQPLESIVQTKTLRVLGNNDTIVIASKTSFYYEENQHMTNSELENFRENFTTFNNLIELFINSKKKLIVQDYTGRDLTHTYCHFLEMYGSKILNSVLFDVSQSNGGCFIELKPTHATIDRHGHFVQEKYLKLAECVGSEMYNDIYKSRLSLFNYPLTWAVCNKNGVEDSYSEFKFENYKLLFFIYECKYDDKYKQESLLTLIKKMLDDMLTSRGIDITIGNSILSKIMNRNEFNKEVRAVLQT